MSYDEVVECWKKEKQLYEQFTEYLKITLDGAIRAHGIKVRILARTKEDKSLIKKLYKKKDFTLDFYKKISDKSAARVICKFKYDVRVVSECIRETFKVINEENKIHNLDFKEQGYKSIHFDIQLKEENTAPEVFAKIGALKGEIQVRTHCEDTWAEIYHDLGYKPSNELNVEINRQFYCLSGLLEVADDCFSNLYQNIKETEVLNEDYALDILTSHYIKIIGNEYDPDFSRENLKILLPIIEDYSPEKFKEEINSFISENRGLIIHIIDERKRVTSLPYATQPELLFIFYLIQKDPHKLYESWKENLFINDLEELFSWWGIPLKDFYTT